MNLGNQGWSTEEAYDRYVLKNYGRPPLTLVRGSGCRIWDEAGREYLDFTTGVGVTALGHCHPHWVEAVRRQAGELIHVSNLFRHPLQGRLAAELVRRAGAGRVFFCNSGAEANETLIKLARLHGVKLSGREGARSKIVCAKDAFHGRTFGGMSATPQEKIQKGFAPLVPGFVFGELNNLGDFERLVDEETAAVLVETIQGEGGVHPCTREFLQGLRALCDRTGTLLLIDEVQCGMGRTGRFFAYEESGIIPDAIGMAKGLGGGFPIGAVWVRDVHAELFTPGSHGTTFGGTPLACAAALAVLEVLDREDLMGRVNRQSPDWHAALNELPREFPNRVAAIRGRGYMVGFQLRENPGPVHTALRELGLLTPLAGGNVIRLLPPLIATAEELTLSVERCREALRVES